MKKFTQKLPVAYVLLLSLQIPFNIAFFMFLLQTATGKESSGSGKFLLLYLLIGIVYFIVLGVLGILNLIRSFQAYQQGQKEHCLHAMLILKYGLVPYFIANFLSMTVLLICAFMGSRGMIIFAFPVVIGVLFFGVFCTWLAMLPGTFYSIQMIRFGKSEQKITSGWAIWHGILQFCFLTDILDTMYLAVCKWKKGKLGAILIGGLYLLSLLLILLVVLNQ